MPAPSRNATIALAAGGTGGHLFPAEALARELPRRSEEHTSELQSLMRNSYAVFCLKKKNHDKQRQRDKANRYHTLKNNKTKTHTIATNKHLTPVNIHK